MALKNLEVYLNKDFVGNLTQFPDGTTVLSFDPEYVSDQTRPTLSLSYKSALNSLSPNTQRRSAGLPPFFSNLLPEGPLRRYLAQRALVKETQEYRLLQALRDDLPGAVKLKVQLNQDFSEGDDIASPMLQRPLRFSLAGVQLKFSGDIRESKIVIPASGVGGHWIVKLPSPEYPFLNELEYSMLQLASNIGITIPETRLLPTAQLENLPHDLPAVLKGECLLSRRFDRTNDGGRIHMEDFAQVFAQIDKYDPRFNYQSIAQVVWLEMGLDAVLEFTRRLVHMVMSGNADMHLKNWSLTYPDRRQPKLSPAYDLVSTVVYKGINRTMALKMAGEVDFQKVNLDLFRKLARIAKLPERAIIKEVLDSVNAIKEAWPKLRGDLPIPKSYKHLIDEHMQAIPLFHSSLT